MRTHKGLAPVLWVIIAAVVLGGGYVLAQKSKSKMENAGMVVEKIERKAETADWQTYLSPAWNFKIQYPSDYYIHDYKVLPDDTFIRAAVIEVRDSKNTYQKYQKEDGPHITDGPNVTVYIDKNFYFENNQAFLDYMYATYPALRGFSYTKGNRVELGLTKGIQFFGQTKNANGPKVNFLSRVGYHDGLVYEIVAYPPEYPHFAPLVSTFRIVE